MVWCHREQTAEQEFMRKNSTEKQNQQVIQISCRNWITIIGMEAEKPRSAICTLENQEGQWNNSVWEFGWDRGRSAICKSLIESESLRMKSFNVQGQEKIEIPA
jgi:hypothetical protein